MKRIMNIRRGAGRSLPMLAVLKTSLEVLSKCGASAPFLQGAVDTVLQIIQYAEHVKQNRKDSLDLALSAAEIVQALSDATEGVNEVDVDDRFKQDLGRFHEDLLAIIVTMKGLTHTNVWLRLLRKDLHSEEIFRHRRALQQAVIAFQIRDGISKRVLAVWHHEEVMGSLKTLTGLISQKNPSRTRTTDYIPTSLPRLRPEPKIDVHFKLKFHPSAPAATKHSSTLKQPQAALDLARSPASIRAVLFFFE